MSKSAKTIPLAKEPQGKDAGSSLIRLEVGRFAMREMPDPVE